MNRAKLALSVALGTVLSLLAAASVLADGGNPPFPR
jgi:hypothetical protein